MTDKEKKKLYDQEYKLKNKEKKKLQWQQYSERNKELISQKKKKYYRDNKDRILEVCKSYRENNPKELTGLKGTGNYNITLAERHKDIWLNIPMILYKLKIVDIDNCIFFKYGLTKNIKKRLYTIPYNVEVLELIHLNKYEAVYKERELLQEVIKYEPKIKFGGYTECFVMPK